MKKKLLLLLLAVISVFACAFALSACKDKNKYESGGILYYMHGSDGWMVWEITDPNATEIVIPSEVGGLPVERISLSNNDYSNEYYSNIKKITLPDSMLNYYSGCDLEKLNALEEATVPICFVHCVPTENLKTLKITKCVNNDHGHGEFSQLKNLSVSCPKLESITIEEGVTERVTTIKKIDCPKLPDLVIPKNVTIASGALSGCTSLESITLPLNSVVTSYYYYANKYTAKCFAFGGLFDYDLSYSDVIETKDENGETINIINTDGINKINSAVPESLKKVTVNGGTITKDTFRGCKYIESVECDKNNPNNSSQNGIIYNKEKTEVICALDSIEGSITLPNTVMEIEAEAFSGCTGLTKINIPQRVIAIPDNAFSGCTGLEEFDIPKTVTSIGKSAFSGCKNLETVEFKDCSTLTSVGEYAFKDCAVTDINLPYTESVGKGAFYNCHLESLDLSRVTEIGGNLGGFIKSAAMPASAFKYIYTSSLVGATVTSGNIGQNLFKDCKNLVRVTLNNDITEIGSYAFQNCVRLKEINLPVNLEKIGYAAFENCCSLVKLNLPSGLSYIGSGAFAGCYKLIEIVNSSSLNITAGTGAAYYAKNVYKPTAGNATHLSDWTYNRFYADGTGSYNYYLMGMTNVSLTELELCDGVYLYGSKVADGYAIYDYAFAYENLTSVTIYNCVTEIGDYAFAYCEKLTDVNFKGTKAQWNAILKSANWDTGSENYTVHCTDGDISK